MMLAFRNTKETDVKFILLQLHKKTPLFLAKTLPEILAPRSPLQDDNLLYYGVYVGGFINKKDNKGMSLRDAIRITAVCLDKTKFTRVLRPAKPGDSLPTAARLMANCWKKSLEDLQMWTDVQEFGDIKGEPEVLNSDVPAALKDKKYDAPFPFTPLYIGYNSDPNAGWKAHAASKFPFHINDVENTKGIIHSLNSAIGTIVRKMNECDLEWQGKLVWTSWHQHHSQGKVHF
jgi:hypothetical protein